MEIMENKNKDNLKNRFCVRKWKDGSKFIGLLEQNKVNGWSKLKNLVFEIRGEFSDNNLNGYGEVLNKEENRIFKGFWINGVLGGAGFEIDSNYSYKGFFMNSQKYGYGIQIWKDGSIYKGEWAKDEYDGFGIYYFPNKQIYHGHWKNNKKCGFGEFSWPNGKKYVGFYKDDKKDGFGFYYLKKGCYSINFWKKGKKHGLGRLINENNVSYVQFEDNEIIHEYNNELEFIDNCEKENLIYIDKLCWSVEKIRNFMDIKE